MRTTFTEIASKILEENRNSVLILGDIGVFGFRKLFQTCDSRVYNLGVLEQSMIGISAGFSISGMIPIVHTIAPFLVERALEQIKIDFGYQKIAGNFVSVGASFDYSALGATHHAPSDVKIISTIPGAHIFLPGHRDELADMLMRNWDNGKLNYFRLSTEENKLPYLNQELVKTISESETSTISIIAVGPMLDRVLEYSQRLNANLYYVNQISLENSKKLNKTFNTEKIILIEPYFSGTLSQVLSESLSKNPHRVLSIGPELKFSSIYGTLEDQNIHFGLSKDVIERKIENFIND